MVKKKKKKPIQMETLLQKNLKKSASFIEKVNVGMEGQEKPKIKMVSHVNIVIHQLVRNLNCMVTRRVGAKKKNVVDFT